MKTLATLALIIAAQTATADTVMEQADRIADRYAATLTTANPAVPHTWKLKRDGRTLLVNVRF